MNNCEHPLGVWDTEYSVIGRNIWVYSETSHLYKDKENFEPFKFCPECGKQLIKD